MAYTRFKDVYSALVGARVERITLFLPPNEQGLTMVETVSILNDRTRLIQGEQQGA